MPRLESAKAAKDFSAVVAGHSNRGNFASLLVQVQVGGAANIDATVGEIHRAFRVIGKPGEKFLAGRQHLKRLVTDFGDTPRHTYIVVVAEHASKRVARKIAGSGPLPRGNHARV